MVRRKLINTGDMEQVMEEYPEQSEVEESNVDEPLMKSPISPIKKSLIEDLPGVGAATAQKLREAGYSDMMSLAVSSP